MCLDNRNLGKDFEGEGRGGILFRVSRDTGVQIALSMLAVSPVCRNPSDSDRYTESM